MTTKRLRVWLEMRAGREGALARRERAIAAVGRQEPAAARRALAGRDDGRARRARQDPARPRRPDAGRPRHSAEAELRRNGVCAVLTLCGHAGSHVLLCRSACILTASFQPPLRGRSGRPRTRVWPPPLWLGGFRRRGPIWRRSGSAPSRSRPRWRWPRRCERANSRLRREDSGESRSCYSAR